MKTKRGMADTFDLSRFETAQTNVLNLVMAELRAGAKRSHWMWFVFPQLAGLGHSVMAQRFAIKSKDEARAYLAHDVLGPRLIECTTIVNAVTGRSVHEIFGSPDDIKFRSSMTLFGRVAPPNHSVFRDALAIWFGAIEDPNTVTLLDGSP
jgi:uncharacterized protein (DUF1810 family)